MKSKRGSDQSNGWVRKGEAQAKGPAYATKAEREETGRRGLLVAGCCKKKRK